MTADQTSAGAAAITAEELVEGSQPSQGRLAALVMTLVALLVALDIHMDWDDGASLVHISTELFTVTLAGVSAAVLLWRLRAARQHARILRGHLEAAHADAAQLRADVERFRTDSLQHARGLGEAIDRQFERWGLSPAEREVALLLVKGLSHKEAAEVRATSERTVRQQALAVYRKAGLAGRAELAAFFLEDLLQPVGGAAPVSGAAAPEAG